MHAWSSHWKRVVIIIIIITNNMSLPGQQAPSPALWAKDICMPCAESFDALSDSLAELEKRSARAPLLCVTDSMDEPSWRETADVASLDGSEIDAERRKTSAGLAEDDWEMLP